MSNLVIRELEEGDLTNGFFDMLRTLTTVGTINSDDAKKRFREIYSNPNYIIKVAEVDGKIVGTTTLFIELKFIHELGKVGHIEDVVTDKNFQGRGIGKKIIHSLLEDAKKMGCYKTILDCDDAVAPFYERINFEGKSFNKHGNCMRYDHIL